MVACQVKYAIVKQTDPFFAWCSQNLHRVEGNCDEHVSLTWDQAAASYVWSATDADEKAGLLHTATGPKAPIPK